jgi:hypothetical protein
MKRTCFVSAAVLACALLFVFQPTIASGQTPVFGQNVNMVSGTDWSTGDPFLQRQNEPSVAVSTRNNLHLLAGANDYRGVDLPGLLGIDARGDAWLGLFKSFDGGLTWKSTLLPGYPLDSSTVGKSSPLFGFQAAADPTVRSGPAGIFYYSGIAFNRTGNTLGEVFVARLIDNNNRENGDPTVTNGSLTNITPTDSIRYLGAVAIASGTSGQFLDKPWLAVDIPRNTNTCTINYTNPDGSSGTQTIPAARVFLSYSMFTGSGGSSKVNVAYSDNCGASFPNSIKISQTNSVNQGTVIAIDPSVPSTSPAVVYVAWRRFASGGQTDAIVLAKSTNGGSSWSKAVDVIDFPATCPTTPTAASCAFDQNTSGTTFRTNAYPALAVDNTGRVYVAVSQRNANGDGRIVMTTSVDGGNTWSAPAAVDNGLITDDLGNPFQNLSGRGHQLMPSLSFSAGQVTLIHFDTRQDHTMGVFTPTFDNNGNATGYSESRELLDDLVTNLGSVFNSYIDDSTLTITRHTIDVQAQQATPAPAGQPGLPNFSSFRVARYFIGFDPNANLADQLQFNPPDLPMFVDGTEAFMGDYLDVAGDPPFVYSSGQWQFNTSNTNPQVFHAVWTDNRDVAQPPNGNWTQYVPPYSNSNSTTLHNSIFDPTQTVPQCVVGTNDGFVASRNQNIYTARIEPGLIVSSPGNQKTLGYVAGNSGTLLLRAFPMYVRNNTNLSRYFRLQIMNQPALANGSLDTQGFASFQQSSGVVTTLDVTLPAFSSIARSVFIQSVNPVASVTVNVFEITTIPNGIPTGSNLNGSAIFNPDPSAPQIINPDALPAQDPSITAGEAYTPIISPALITNPLTNSLILSPQVSNPAIKGNTSVNYALQNPAIKGNTALNPAIKGNATLNTSLYDSSVYNTSVANDAAQNQTINDALYTVTNTGNTAATYAVKLYNGDSTLSNLPSPLCSMNGNVQPCTTLQLILAKQYLTPTQQGCNLALQNNFQTFANVAPVFVSDPTQLGDPKIFDPTTSNATLSLAPGETGFIIVRGNLSQTALQQVINVSTPVVVAHAANTGNANPPATLAITSTSQPAGTVNLPYNGTVAVFGGTAPYTFSIINGNLPPGLQLNTATGAITNSPTSSGAYPFTVQVTDSAPGTKNVATQAFTINVATQLQVSGTTLPDAIIGAPYSAMVSVTGGTAPYTVSLVGGALPSGLTLSTSGLITGTPDNSNPNGALFSPMFQIKDSGSPVQTATATLTLHSTTVLSAGSASITLPTAVAGQPYNANLTATGGSGGYTWSVTAGALPANLVLNSTGSITGTPQTPGNSSFTLTVQDQSNPAQTASTTASLQISAQLQITAITLPDGVVGTSYSQSFTATGGTGTLTWSATGVPAGLSLSSGGVLSGTPTTAGTTSITVHVTDSGSPAQSVSSTFSLRIAVPLAITAITLPDGVAGTPYAQAFAASGGTGSLTWSATGLPAGLSMSSGGVLSGTPTTAGTTSFTVQVTDSGSPAQTASGTFSMRIAVPLTITAIVLPDGIAGTPYSQSFAASGGTGTLTWSATGLPAGLSMSSGGTLSGTPTTAGTTSFTVRATDSGSPAQTASTSFSLRIAISLAINPMTLPDGVIGVGYSQAFASTGGTGSLTWSATGLPAGLSMSSGGVLSGTPTTAGTTSFTVRATDSGSPAQTASANFNVRIAVPLAVTVITLPDGMVGTSYSQALTATGGTGALSWSLVGSLPAGLTLSSSGVISGTPTAATSGVSFSVRVQDSGSPAQVVTSGTFTIRVAAKLVVVTASLPAATYGKTYSQSLSASGGLGTYSWSLASGSGQLPTGLSLSASGVISGTPTAVGSFPITVRVADGSQPQQQVATQALTIVVSPQYNVVFTVQPSNSSPGSQITPSVKVMVTDSKGNAVKGAVCQASLAVNPGNGTLSGSTTATTGNNGIAIFASQSINNTGNGYQMLVTVTSPAGGGSVLSVPFNIR